MNWRHCLILFILGLLVPFTVSRFQDLPGYMDADYYFAGGVELAKGNGFNEPYIWNYLEDPQGLPHPSHTYWMPLASIVSAIGMWLAGSTTYAAGRLPFILLSACVPLLTATLAFDISRNRLFAIVSGALSIFSLYYTPFMPVPDNYAIFMLFGGTSLLLAPRKQKWIPLVLGMLSGFMTLARSDGLLWLGLAGLTVMWKSMNKEDGTRNSFKEWLGLIIPGGLLALLGYFMIMGGWHYRNYTLFGTFMSPGGGRVLWMEEYNQIFNYPADSVILESFLNAGWSAAIEDRIWALKSNLNNAFAAQGGIFTFPFILIGLWQLRKEFRSRLAVTGWLILFLVMTLIFPFAGARGAFFHGGAAFQLYWWVMAPIGVDRFVRWFREYETRKPPGNSFARGLEKMVMWLRTRARFTDVNAPTLYQIILVMLAMITTYYLVDLRIFGEWDTEDEVYASVEEMFIDHGYSPQVAVIVRNPPGYYINSGRPAVVLPNGDETVILQVAKRYDARLLVLEKGGTLKAFRHLYDDPDGSAAFTYLGEVDEAKLYFINIEP